MRRHIPLLVVILVIQAGLAGVLAARRNPLAASTPQTALITVPLDKVDHITIEAAPTAGTSVARARIELVKQADQWVLPDYFGAPVDKFRLSSVLSELQGLKRGLPIATSSAALRRFKLEDGDFDRKVTLRQGGRVLSTVYFGSSAGVRKTDARTAQDHAVYNVDLATYELPTSPSDWLDEDILQRDPASLTELDVERGGAPASLTLVRATDAAGSKAAAAATSPASPRQWQASSALPAGRVLNATDADNLAREIAELHVEGILGTSPQAQWHPEHPLLTLRIRDSQHGAQPATWLLYAPTPPPTPAAARSPGPGRSKGSATPVAPGSAGPAAASTEAFYVLKDSARPWYFKISSASGKQLLDDSAPEQLLATSEPAAKVTPPASALTQRARRSHGRRPGA